MFKSLESDIKMVPEWGIMNGVELKLSITYLEEEGLYILGIKLTKQLV